VVDNKESRQSSGRKISLSLGNSKAFHVLQSETPKRNGVDKSRKVFFSEKKQRIKTHTGVPEQYYNMVSQKNKIGKQRITT